MRPSARERVTRLIFADTGIARLVTSLGLWAIGAAMALDLGTNEPGYGLLSKAMPLCVWGWVFLLAGSVGIYGVFGRIPYVPRLALCLAGMYLWAVVALSQNAHEPTPMRLLLVLPAVVELWVLIKVALLGRREE